MVSSTLIYGKRDAVLVDTFMTVDQNDVLGDDDLCDARPRRSLVRDRSAARTVSRRASSRFAGCRQDDEGAVARGIEVVVAGATSGADSRATGDCRGARRQ